MKSLNDIYDAVKELRESADSLTAKLSKEGGGDDINDWGNMRVVCRDLLHFPTYYFAYGDFKNLISDVETDKDRFLIQKVAKYYFKIFKREIDARISWSREVHFEDYRCRNFQKRAEDTFVEIKNFIREYEEEEEYNDDDEYDDDDE